MGCEGVAARVAKLAEPLALALGYEIVEVTYQREPPGWVLRLLLDRPGGVTLSDCERFSQVLGPVLDREDPIPHAYTLEVSSPGVERPLHKEADYQRFAGQPAEIRLFAPINGRRRWQGVLAGLDNEKNLLLSVGTETVRLPLASISRAHLLYRP